MINTVILETILIILFFFHVGKVILYEIYLWQLKEYRFDRMRAHLETAQGKKLIFNLQNLSKWILLFVLLINSSRLIYLFILVSILLIYLAEIALLFYKGASRLKYPVITIKSLFLIVSTFGVVVYLVLVIRFDILLVVLILDRILSMIIILLNAILKIPTFFYKELKIFKATKKRGLRQDVISIGITGSFGKTSTKEFLASILSSKFKVAKTLDYHNTEVGVAQDIITQLSCSDDVFIAEMGAYKSGEIAKITRMVKPKIGIITGINTQHLGLFGSIDKIKRAKFELVSNLEKNGAVIFNSNNIYVQELIDRTKKERPDLKIYEYKRVEKKDKKELTKNNKLYISGSNIEIKKDGLRFDMTYCNRTFHCKTRLIGSQNIDNILAASLIAIYKGITIKDIVKSIEELTPPRNTMRKLIGYNHSVFIDDTFNANPCGIEKTLEYMSIFAGNKILVLTPLIELGSKAEDIHEILGKKIARVCNLIILTNNNYYHSFMKGAQSVGSKQKVKILKENTVDLLKSNIDKKSIVVFCGKEAWKVLKQFKINN